MRQTLKSHRRIPNPKDPSTTVFIPVRSHLWSEEGLDGFRKCYDVLLDLYVEPRGEVPAVLTFEDVGLYMKHVRLLWLGQAYSVKEFAKSHGMDFKTYISKIDRLQDAELVHRERCVDLRGQPIDIVLRTPYPRERFLKEHARLAERVRTKATAAERLAAHKAGQPWPPKTLNLKARLAKLQQIEQDAKLKQIQAVVDSVIHLSVGRAKPLTEEELIRRVKARCKVGHLPYGDRTIREAIGQHRVFVNVPYDIGAKDVDDFLK